MLGRVVMWIRNFKFLRSNSVSDGAGRLKEKNIQGNTPQGVHSLNDALSKKSYTSPIELERSLQMQQERFQSLSDGRSSSLKLNRL
jgi:hypothetical protein